MDDHTSDNFRMFLYKVQRCSLRVGWHAWHECPYQHRGEIRARRRDPLLHYYMNSHCPDVKKSGSCPRRDGCWHAHNTFEFGLHPCYYRTEKCKYGADCNRRVCFFAHTNEELRYRPLAVDSYLRHHGRRLPAMADADYEFHHRLQQLLTHPQPNVDVSRAFNTYVHAYY